MTMTDLEHKIFTRALETLYGSVLLGEEQTLSYVEHLTYLNRALGDTVHSRWPLSSEVDLIRRVHALCWPERPLEIYLEEGLPVQLQVGREALFAPVCRLLLEADEQGGFPTSLTLAERNGAMEYRLLVGAGFWRGGRVDHG